MKLKVYQQGGGLIYTPFIPGRTISSISGDDSGNSSSGGDDPKIDPLNKEILALMKDQNLLPSDIQAISNAVIAFQRRTQHLSGLGTDGYRSAMPGMLQIMSMVSTAKHNREYWDGKVTEMRQHDAGSDVALDSYGRMWVQDKDGKLTRINPNDFDKEKYNPVSNSQLMYLRQRDFGFGDDLIDDTGMSLVGLKDVQKELDDMINNLGSIKSSSPRIQKLSDIASDLQGLGVFQTTQKYDKGDLTDFSQLLYERLSKEGKNLVDANAAIGGYDKFNYILNIIRSETDREESTTFDPSLTKAVELGGSGSGEGKEQLMKDTYPERLTTGEDIVPYWTNIMTNQSGHTIWAYTQDMGPIMKNGNPIGTVNFDRVLTEFDAAGIIDWSHVTFGDQKLDTIDFPKVVYDGGSTIKRVWMPVKKDGTVDFKAQEELSKLQNWINDNGVINDALIEERVQEIEGAEWDKEHKVVRFKDAKPFLVVRGIVSSDKVRFNTDSPYVWKMEKTEGDPRKDWLTMYNNAIATGTSTEGKKRYDYGTAAGRHLYEGNIFLPINSPTIGALVYNDQQVPKSRYMDIRQTAEQNQKAQGFIGNYGE